MHLTEPVVHDLSDFYEYDAIERSSLKIRQAHSVLGSFNNHVDKILTIFDPYPPQMDKRGHLNDPLPTAINFSLHTVSRNETGTIDILWYKIRSLWVFIKCSKNNARALNGLFLIDICQGFPKRY